MMFLCRNIRTSYLCSTVHRKIRSFSRDTPAGTGNEYVTIYLQNTRVGFIYLMLGNIVQYGITSARGTEILLALIVPAIKSRSQFVMCA